jgi:hypothetical protein
VEDGFDFDEDGGEGEDGSSVECESCGESSPESEVDIQEGPGGNFWFSCAHCGGWSFC